MANMKRAFIPAIVASGLILLAGVAAFSWHRDVEAQSGDDLSGDWALVLDHPALGTVICTAHIDARDPSVLLVWLLCSDLESDRTVIRGTLDPTTGDFTISGALSNIVALSISGHNVGSAALTGTWMLEGFEEPGSFAGHRTTILWGDADCSGIVDSRDALLILQFDRHLADYPVKLPCYGLADTNLSGFVEGHDAFLIVDLEAGLITRLPIFIGFIDSFCYDTQHNYEICSGAR